MDEEPIWSNTDFPYMCLLDKVRTLAFKKAIESTVKPGNTVVDMGSGSGILSLFAARAGAGKVYAVELDHSLAEALKKTAAANDFGDVIEVVEGDAMTVDLPKDVDVVIAELIETGLIDEMQVPVMNRLIKDGILGEKTQTIPSAYTTFIEPVHSQQEQYGFKIMAPVHDWPFFHDSIKGSWSDVIVNSLAERQEVIKLDFKQQNDPLIDQTLEFDVKNPAQMTGFKMSGIVWLRDDQPLGPTNTLNSDKVFIIDPVAHKDSVIIHISYKMGEGVKTLEFNCKAGDQA